MQIVIDIPEEVYESCKAIYEILAKKEIVDTYTYAIATGTPLNNIKSMIENYSEFILCANGKKGIHIDAVLEMLNGGTE